MSQIRSEFIKALREGMLRTGSADAAFVQINEAFHELAHAISEVASNAVMIGRLADTQTGGDMDAMAAAGKGGAYPVFVKPTAEPGFVVVVALLVTSPTGFPVELRFADESHVAAGRSELDAALKAFAASPHVARAVMASATHASIAGGVVTATRQ